MPLLVGLGTLLYSLLLATHTGAVAGGSDSSGYMNHARLLAQGNLHVPERQIPGLPSDKAPDYLYIPLGFRPSHDAGMMVPTYPSGLALALAAMQTLTGWDHAGDFTVILHAIAGLFAVYLLGRTCGLGQRLSALAAALVGLSPVYLFMSLQAMSDVPSLVWTTLSIVAALKAGGDRKWALAAGAAVSVDVLLRPANAIVFIPLAIILAPSRQRWLPFILGGVPGALFFMAHSRAAYGSLLTTGYGDSSGQFYLGYVPGTLLHYAHWIPLAVSPLCILFLFLPFAGSVERRRRVLLLAWFGVYACFYCAYKCTHEAWWYLRFLLPATPALVVGSLLVARQALLRAFGSKHTAFVATAAVLAAAALADVALWTNKLHALEVGREEKRYGHLALWLKANVPSNAVCASMQTSGALLYYTPFTFVRWDVLTPATAEKVREAAAAAGEPIYAALFPFEIETQGIFREHFPGAWNKVGEVEGISIFRLDPPSAAKP